MSCGCDTGLNSGPVRVDDYYSEVQPTWCGGCGNFGIWTALKRALVELELAPDQVLLAFDIGCNGNMSDKIRGYRLHSLHGRVLPLAAGAKIANRNVKVIAMAGDGATYSEGINHLINSFRNNFPITFLVHNNGDYGLTTGQASATTPQGAVRTANPDGPTASTLNPIDLALSLQPSFVARGYSGDIKHLTEILKAAILHQDHGFGFVDILQSCPTYNHERMQWWYEERVKNINDAGNYSKSDINKAREIASPIGDTIYTGVLYENKEVPNYLGRLEYRKDKWGNSTLTQEVIRHDISGFMEELK